MAPRRQRLVLAVIAVVVLIGAGLLAAAGLKDSATYFYAPSDIAANRPESGQSIRLGGLVKAGSVERGTDGLTLNFAVIDANSEMQVSYRGIVPDLFRENQGVIATGHVMPDGRFVAQELLAKHDENYMPPEVAKALEKQLKATQPSHPSN